MPPTASYPWWAFTKPCAQSHARGPLSPFDPDSWDYAVKPPAFLPVHTTLPATPPKPSIEWWRGNAWGVTVPGLPAVDGGASGPAQSRVLTYFIDRYGADWEDAILLAHQQRGYTHFSISPQDSFAAGLSLSEYVAMARRVKDACFYVHHLLRSKYYTDIHPDLDDMNPVIDALLDADVLDVWTPAWEMNYWSPEICRQMIDHDAARIGSRSRGMLHFYPHYIAWQPNNQTPTDFWVANIGKVSGVLYQCDPNWSVGMMQARINDGLVRLIQGGLWGLPQTFDYTVWETIATLQFKNRADEDRGDLVGYETLCAQGPMTVQGFGNGARMPDGSVI